MNPFPTNKGISNKGISNKGTLVGLLIAVGFTSGLVASELHDGSQQNNRSQAAQLQLIEQEACPYPPQTPAATGAEGGHGESLQPRMRRQPAPLVRPAIYMELLVPADEGDIVLLTI